jgi:hypothetical protein
LHKITPGTIGSYRLPKLLGAGDLEDLVAEKLTFPDRSGHFDEPIETRKVQAA